MNGLLLTTQQALQLLFTGDSELWSIVLLSFSVSIKAILLTTPFAFLVSLDKAQCRNKVNGWSSNNEALGPGGEFQQTPSVFVLGFFKSEAVF